METGLAATVARGSPYTRCPVSMSLLVTFPFLLCWGGLAVLTAVNLLAFRRLPRPVAPPGAGDELPSLTVVIPARNEERDLGPALDSVLAQDYPGLEVRVVDDGSTDGTPETIAVRSADSRLVPLRTEGPPPGWLGKPHAIHVGSREAGGEWLLFLDADVRLRRGALRAAVSDAISRGLDHLALFPAFEQDGFWEKVLMPVLGTIFFVLLPSFLARDRRFGGFAFGSGAFALVRASAYRAVGGHERLRSSVVDDVRLAVELKRAGFRSDLRLGDDAVRLRMYRGRREIVEGFTKNLHVLMRDRPLLGGLNLTLGNLLQVGPFLWPLWWLGGALAGAPAAAGSLSAAGILLAASLALALLCRGAVQLRLRYPLWPALLHPFMMLAWGWISLRSWRMVEGEGMVRWRGRSYPVGRTRF